MAITPIASDELAVACSESRLEADLGWALGSVFRAYLKSVHAVVDGLPGGPRGYQLLTAANTGEPCSQQALGAKVGVDRSVMTYLVDDLQTAGLVERQPDLADRRARRVVVTELGRARLTDLDEQLERVEAHMLGVLAEPDRDTFRTLLFQIAARADALDPANSACAVVEDVAKLTS